MVEFVVFVYDFGWCCLFVFVLWLCLQVAVNVCMCLIGVVWCCLNLFVVDRVCLLLIILCFYLFVVVLGGLCLCFVCVRLCVDCVVCFWFWLCVLVFVCDCVLFGVSCFRWMLVVCCVGVKVVYVVKSLFSFLVGRFVVVCLCMCGLII